MIVKNEIVILSIGLSLILTAARHSAAALTAYNTFDKSIQFDYSADPGFWVQSTWGSGTLTMDSIANASRSNFGKALKVSPQVCNVCASATPNVLSHLAGTVEFWFAPNWNGTNKGGSGVGGSGTYNGFFCDSKSGNFWGAGLQIFIFNNNYPSDGGQLFAYWDDGTQSVTFNNSTLQPAPGGTIYGTTANWVLGEWHHIAFCWDQNWLGLYMDGGIIMKTARTHINSSTFTNFFLWGRGTETYAERSCNGWVDDLAIWNEARYSGAYTPPDSRSEIGSCSSVWSNGYGFAADLNKDCHVDFGDLARFMEGWARCYDPEDAACEKTWKWW